MLLSFALTLHGQACALRVEQRQQVDLAAVVERLRAAERRLGRAAARLQRFGRCARRASATSAFSTSSSARTIPSS